MARLNGFTLIELMTTIAVVAILLVIAIPSYEYLMTTNRLAGEINEFTSSLNFARSEAIKRGQQIVVCKSNTQGCLADSDPSDCSCTNAGDWGQGWIIFVDSLTINDAVDVGETIVKGYPPLEGGAIRDTLTGAVNVANRIHFNRNGFSGGPGISSGTVRLCDNHLDTSKARALMVELSGRIQLAQDGNGNGIVEDDSGTDVSCP